jgi:hypothetical protein
MDTYRVNAAVRIKMAILRAETKIRADFYWLTKSRRDHLMALREDLERLLTSCCTDERNEYQKRIA